MFIDPNKRMKSSPKGKFILCCVLATNFSFSQKSLRLGIKLHPNMTFTSLPKKHDFDKTHFKKVNGSIGFNLDLASNYQLDHWIFEISSGINTNKTGLKFEMNVGNFNNKARLEVKTVSFSNEIGIGYRVYTSNSPYFELFVMPTVSYNFTGVQKLGGKGDFNSAALYQEIYPDINRNWQSFSVGIGLKTRTELKNHVRFDYGISYNYAFTKSPEIGMIILVNNKEYSSRFQPCIHTLNFDFIYYFGKRKKMK
jgi:hypothetical protein